MVLNLTGKWKKEILLCPPLQDASSAASSVWAGCPTPRWWRPSSASQVWLFSAAAATWRWPVPWPCWRTTSPESPLTTPPSLWCKCPVVPHQPEGFSVYCSENEVLWSSDTCSDVWERIVLVELHFYKTPMRAEPTIPVVLLFVEDSPHQLGRERNLLNGYDMTWSVGGSERYLSSGTLRNKKKLLVQARCKKEDQGMSGVFVIRSTRWHLLHHVS